MTKVHFSKLDSFGCDPLGKDDVYSLEGFKQLCESGAFVDYDGFGEFVDENREIMSCGLVKPSHLMSKRYRFPKNAKYIVWYNR